MIIIIVLLARCIILPMCVRVYYILTTVRNRKPTIATHYIITITIIIIVVAAMSTLFRYTYTYTDRRYADVITHEQVQWCIHIIYKMQCCSTISSSGVYIITPQRTSSPTAATLTAAAHISFIMHYDYIITVAVYVVYTVCYTLYTSTQSQYRKYVHILFFGIFPLWNVAARQKKINKTRECPSISVYAFLYIYSTHII